MLSLLTSGESHGPALTAILDGLPAGMQVDIDSLNYQLSRRQKGYGRGGRMRIENDQVRIISGVRHGCTLGGPITLLIENRDWENWKKLMDPTELPCSDLSPKQQKLLTETRTPRPGHADLAGGIKLNHHDLRNVLERASARETAARVAGSSLTRQLLEHFEICFASHVVRIGSVQNNQKNVFDDLSSLIEMTEKSDLHCADAEIAEQMKKEIRKAIEAKDSLGGVVEIIVRGLPVGLGGFSQSSDRLDGKLASAMMSIQSVKGVEIGLGFSAAQRRGSEVHDQIYYDSNSDPKRKNFYRGSNNAGGLEGGITTGEDIIIRIACKPISTLNQPLDSVNVETKEPAKAMVERTDCCIVPALAVICEAAAAYVLADAFLNKFGSDNMEEIKRNYQGFLDSYY